MKGVTGTSTRYPRLLGWISVLAIVVAVLLCLWALPAEQFVEALNVWGQNAASQGAMLFALLFVVATLFLAPAWPFSIAAGAVFGLVRGTILVSLASTTTAAFAFLIARYSARNRVANWVQRHPRFNAIDQAIGEKGWKIVALLRLSPVVPFNLQNYLYGVTAVRFWPCLLASWAAMLPATFMYVYLGYLGAAGFGSDAEGETAADASHWALQIIGFVATVAATAYVTHLARSAIRKHTTIGSQAEGNNPVDQA